MTIEEAKKILEEYSWNITNCGPESFAIATLLEYVGKLEKEQEPCEDCVSRKAVRDTIFAKCSGENLDIDFAKVMLLQRAIKAIPSVTPQEPRKGEWIRMSDLSEQEDDRYKCSHCGNVIHHKNKMDLYTFNSWCGRCGSDNGRHINYEVSE